jgi:anhydro-N-acetylmuramic acid kinase
MSPQVFGEALVTQIVQLARQQQWEHNDLLCTATHLIAQIVSAAVCRLMPTGQFPQRVLLSGGGVRNGLLWQLLEQHLPGIPLAKTDQHGVPGDQRRALAHALLAALTLDGVPANIPGATGASGARLIGSLTPGSPANWARCLSWMALSQHLTTHQPLRLAG